jgi:hypothetical protein
LQHNGIIKICFIILPLFFLLSVCHRTGR